MSPKESAILAAVDAVVSERKLPTLDVVRKRMDHPGRVATFRSSALAMEAKGLCVLTQVTDDTRPLGLMGRNPTIITRPDASVDKILQDYVPPLSKRQKGYEDALAMPM